MIGISMSELVQIISKYGFPVVAAGGMAYMVFTVWRWATTEIKPVISEANAVLMSLKERIRILDQDLIRLNQKVDVVMHLRGKTIDLERINAEITINREYFNQLNVDEELLMANVKNEDK